MTGGSGSGKTRIIRELRAAFPDSDLCIVSQDEYYRPREEQAWDGMGYQNFDLPESIDQALFVRDLDRLVAGESVEKEQYVFNNPAQPRKMLCFVPAPVILIEGLFVLHVPGIRERLDLKLFVDAEDVIKLKRRIVRDAGERNYPLEDVLHRYEHHVLPSYRSFIEPCRQMADLVINNHTTYDQAIEVIRILIESKVRAARMADLPVG